MPRDAVSRTAHVGTVGKNGLMGQMTGTLPLCGVDNGTHLCLAPPPSSVCACPSSPACHYNALVLKHSYLKFIIFVFIHRSVDHTSITQQISKINAPVLSAAAVRRRVFVQSLPLWLGTGSSGGGGQQRLPLLAVLLGLAASAEQRQGVGVAVLVAAVHIAVNIMIMILMLMFTLLKDEDFFYIKKVTRMQQGV